MEQKLSLEEILTLPDEQLMKHALMRDRKNKKKIKRNYMVIAIISVLGLFATLNYQKVPSNLFPFMIAIIVCIMLKYTITIIETKKQLFFNKKM
jgi:uncharacterized membrane protein